jgi:uncharacterized hydrophobic protein (TIGR00341 family)
MRLVEVLVPKGKREAIVDILEDEDIDYVLTEEASARDPSAVISFPLPAPAVEPILNRLRDVKADEDSYTVVIKAETVLSRQFEDLEKRYEEDDAKSRNRIAREELFSRAQDMSPAFRTFVLMTVISALVATTGLLLDSAAVVVGSMVIAPLLGPAIGASVGTVLDEQGLFRKGIKLQTVGLVAAVVAATLFTLFVQATNLVPPGTDVLTISEISSRVSPDLLSLVIAMGAGIAGAWSLTSGASEVLVGVMVAAALVPPLGVVGIGIAYGLPVVVLSASIVVLINVFAINLTALGVLWYKGYRPPNWYQQDTARSATRKRATMFIALTIVLSSFLGVVSYDSYRTATFEQDLRNDIPATVNATTGNGVELLDVEVQYQDPVPFQQPQRVIVTVGVPPGTDPPPLARILEQRADTRIRAAFDLPYTGPLIEANRADVDVRYTLRDT